MIKSYTVKQKGETVQIGINLNHIVSIAENKDNDPNADVGATVLHLRMLNGDYLNVVESYETFISDVNN